MIELNITKDDCARLFHFIQRHFGEDAAMIREDLDVMDHLRSIIAVSDELRRVVDESELYTREYQPWILRPVPSPAAEPIEVFDEESGCYL